MISQFLLFSFLISFLFSAPQIVFKKKLDGIALAKENIKQFEDRGEYGVAVNRPADINQRNYLGLTREAATQMVNIGPLASGLEILEQVYEPEEITVEPSEEMSEATDIAILIIIIGLLAAAVYYMYNKTVQTEAALLTSIKLQKEFNKDAEAKEAKDRDRVKEAKNVLRLLEKYDRKKKRKSLEESSTEISTEDQKKKKKEKKKHSEFGRVVLSITEGGYKIPWVEGSGKLIELGPGLVKSMLEPTLATPLRCAPPEQRRKEKAA